ncbi:MAG TPA: ribonuclease P protein component [Candidatus Saccharimonadales bacterium]|nr:ribonuclease P protein component [Candidatus Saccharimonadales bacterium]
MIHSTHRFHGRSALRFVYQKGVVVRGEVPIALRYARNPRARSWRAAVVVSRKVSKAAVVRNRIRRRIFEIVRQHAAAYTPQYDLVFSVYDAALATMDYETLERIIVGQLQKAGILAAPTPPGGNHGIVNKEGDA